MKTATRDADPEPRWLTALPADTRRRARRLLERLVAAGVADAEGVTRRDIVGDVAAVAAVAVTRAVAALGDDASPSDVAHLLADGRDDGLGVRWRLVDGDGRPIVVDASTRRR